MPIFISADAVEFFDVKRKKSKPDNLRVAQSIFEKFLVQWTMWTMTFSFPASPFYFQRDISKNQYYKIYKIH
jgi:hypothetical protein